MNDQMTEAQNAMLKLGQQYNVPLPSKQALEELRARLPKMLGTERWQRCADMTRQVIERYLTDIGVSLELTPVVAGILANAGTPWAVVQAELLLSEK